MGYESNTSKTNDKTSEHVQVLKSVYSGKFEPMESLCIIYDLFFTKKSQKDSDSTRIFQS